MLLVIETATTALSIALIEGDRMLDERHEVVGRGHAERLLPAIADLLGHRRPHAITVDCGPGSFTGVRVGLAAAQGLRIGWGVPLHGFSATALLAAAHGAGAVALTGGHGELFVELFDLDPLCPREPLRSLSPAEAAAVVSDARVVGSGARAVVAARGWGETVDALPRAADFVALPAALATLAPVPLYGRAPDARPLPASAAA